MFTDPTAAEVERARSLAAPPYDPARLALLGAKRPVAELIELLEQRADAIAAELALLRRRG